MVEAEEDVGAAVAGDQHDQGTEPLAEEEQEDVVAVAAAVVFAVVVVVENKTDGRVVSHDFPEAEEHGSVVLEIKFKIKY